MKIRAILAICVGRCVKLAAKLLRRGATSMPGQMAVKVCPALPRILAQDLEMIVVTGTNGKTTTCRILEQALEDGGVACTANRSGANLMGGLVTMLMDNATLTGKPKKKVAVFECDEAVFRKVVPMVQPKVILVTNLFRDQLDRYGSMENVLDYIREGIQGAPDAKVCLNADCSLTASLALDVQNECTFFGFDELLGGGEAPTVSAAPNCIRCGAAYNYDYRIYGHLGGFVCPACGYRRPDTQLTVMERCAADGDSTTVRVDSYGQEHTLRIDLPADYNVYNAIGAVAAAITYGVAMDTALQACEHFSCGFGRMEKLSYRDMTIRMILVKNAVGCDQVIDYLCNIHGAFLPVFLLNNRVADGTDISWIDEANFEKLADAHGGKALVAGECAQALADRLIRAGFDPAGVFVQQDLDQLVNAMVAYGGDVYVVPNYTAMLAIHGKLASLCGSNQFWEK